MKRGMIPASKGVDGENDVWKEG
ncbi:hypothetical protein BSG1_13266 [Bacillus sp. SG-1]|nr:hypothetical protein BSG1_13266 [Bacillus sp. SG-1]